jgi:hypothetical protein
MTGPGQPYTKLTFVIAPASISAQSLPKNVIVRLVGRAGLGLAPPAGRSGVGPQAATIPNPLMAGTMRLPRAHVRTCNDNSRTDVHDYWIEIVSAVGDGPILIHSQRSAVS